MSQVDTYHPAELPSDAVMTPAAEPFPEAHLAAQPELSQNDPAMQPARRPVGSYSLERLRNRSRGIPKDLQWVSTEHSPISAPSAARNEMPRLERPARAPFSNGEALKMLMRSAARGQHAPAPALTMTNPPFQVPSQPQMRGALRQVVRDAQQPGLWTGGGR